MIPYFTLQTISFGPLEIQTWGLMVALGLLAGTYAASLLARKRGLDAKIIWDIAPWIIFVAFVAARLFHVFFYEPAYFFSHPAEIIAVWKGGLAVSGGLIGAVIIGVWLLRKKGADVLSYADVFAFGLPLGAFIGRIGCFITHLHPGKATNFFLGVMYPNGVIRHDLGLYLSLDGLVLFLIFLLLKDKQLPKGSFVVGYLIWYGVTRFFLDALRATDGAIVDVRYLGLTPAQYVSIVLLASGLFGLWKIRKPQSV